MKRPYLLIGDNIRNVIIAGRREKYGSEQISVMIKGWNTNHPTYDPLEQTELCIGIKIVESVPERIGFEEVQSVPERKTYGMVVDFPTGDVTDENIQKAINYLIENRSLSELIYGHHIKPINVNRLKK